MNKKGKDGSQMGKGGKRKGKGEENARARLTRARMALRIYTPAPTQLPLPLEQAEDSQAEAKADQPAGQAIIDFGERMPDWDRIAEHFVHGIRPTRRETPTPDAAATPPVPLPGPGVDAYKAQFRAQAGEEAHPARRDGQVGGDGTFQPAQGEPSPAAGIPAEAHTSQDAKTASVGGAGIPQGAKIMPVAEGGPPQHAKIMPEARAGVLQHAKTALAAGAEEAGPRQLHDGESPAASPGSLKMPLEARFFAQSPL